MTEQNQPQQMENQGPSSTPEDGQTPGNLENQAAPVDVDPEGADTADAEAAASRFGYRPPAFTVTCDKCPAVVGADDQATADGAMADHVKFAHDDEAADEDVKRLPPTPAPTESSPQGQE